jgi:hypothetical protein
MLREGELLMSEYKGPPPTPRRLVEGDPEAVVMVNEAKAPNPKTLMGNLKVPNFSVIPSIALIHEARAMEYGAYHAPRKDGGRGYGPFNWRDSNIEYLTYVEAAVRHIMSAADREDIDPETGDFKVPHLALARATLGILIDALEHGTVIDNRPANARGRTAELLRELKKQ